MIVITTYFDDVEDLDEETKRQILLNGWSEPSDDEHHEKALHRHADDGGRYDD